MEHSRSEQIEALGTLKEYNVKIVKAINEVITELKGEKKEDTGDYFNKIMEGINWEIQILNRTLTLINENEHYIEKEKINDVILCLNKSIKAKDDDGIVKVLELELYPFLSRLNDILDKVIA